MRLVSEERKNGCNGNSEKDKSNNPFRSLLYVNVKFQPLSWGMQQFEEIQNKENCKVSKNAR